MLSETSQARSYSPLSRRCLGLQVFVWEKRAGDASLEVTRGEREREHRLLTIWPAPRGLSAQIAEPGSERRGESESQRENSERDARGSRQGAVRRRSAETQ